MRAAALAVMFAACTPGSSPDAGGAGGGSALGEGGGAAQGGAGGGIVGAGGGSSFGGGPGGGTQSVSNCPGPIGIEPALLFPDGGFVTSSFDAGVRVVAFDGGILLLEGDNQQRWMIRTYNLPPTQYVVGEQLQLSHTADETPFFGVPLLSAQMLLERDGGLVDFNSIQLGQYRLPELPGWTISDGGLMCSGRRTTGTQVCTYDAFRLRFETSGQSTVLDLGSRRMFSGFQLMHGFAYRENNEFSCHSPSGVGVRIVRTP